jgi:RNA polymerase sigma-70 factor (ECF subfamily)
LIEPYPREHGRRLEIDELIGGGRILARPELLARAVEAARRGDARGWDALFERFHADVHAYALARLGDWAGAEDVTQETFVAAVGSIHGLRDSREPVVRAWILHICRHKVVDHLRGRYRRERPLDLGSPAVQDPAEIVETRLLADDIRDAMSELTEDQRDILVRRFVLDHSLEDVATGTGRSVGAVKSLQHRALAALGRVLAQRRAA